MRRLYSRIGKSLGLLGPSFIAAVAYLDPGNFATNFSAGASYGYMLIWVVVLANIMAMIIQYLSARIGILTGRTLPELIAQHSSRPIRLLYWLQAQIVTIATDIAEVVGGAVALKVIAGIPILVGALITVVVSTLILMTQGGRKHKVFERLIFVMVVLISIGIFWNVVVASPQPRGVLSGLQPRFAGEESLLLAAGILGATVMPHAIYIHSALIRDRFGTINRDNQDAMLRVTRIDILVSMTLAGAVNAAMILIAAAAFQGIQGVDTLEGVHAAIHAHLGSLPAWDFAFALFFAGLASTTVGSYSGSVVMGGLLDIKVTPLFSRLLTAFPAIILLACGVDPTYALVISQVILSFGIPFVLVPLIALTMSTRIVRRRLPLPVLVIAIISTLLIVALNCALLISLLA